MIQTDGSTDLAQVASNYFLYAHGTTTGPELTFNGTAVVAGQFGSGWAPIGAVQTASGYDIAWKSTSAGLYTAWTLDSNGNYVSSIMGMVP